MMKAAVIDAYGSAAALRIREMPGPDIAADQVLVEAHAAGVNPIDWKIREGLMSARFGDAFPMILGMDVSGVVVATGAAVTRFSKGDEVWARSDTGTGHCYAEFVALNAGTVARKPPELSHVEAASVPLAALTALIGLRDCAQVKAGDRILVVGASGGVGVFAIQLAKSLDAHVTAVCSGRNAGLVRALGADRVIDYTREDVLRDSDRFALIYDAVGSQDAQAARRCLAPGGVYITLVPGPGISFFVPGQTERIAGSCYFVAWTPSAADLDVLAARVREGRLRPVIDSVYSLEDIGRAHERSESLHAVGKIVVRVR